MAASASVFSRQHGKKNTTKGGRASLFWDWSSLDEKQNQTEI